MSNQQDLDSVTEDAIREHATIPPTNLPQDQRRAHLGGQFSRQRGVDVRANPYTDPGCAEAWRRGYYADERLTG